MPPLQKPNDLESLILFIEDLSKVYKNEKAEQMLKWISGDERFLALLTSSPEALQKIAEIKWTPEQVKKMPEELQMVHRYYTEAITRIHYNGINHYSGYAAGSDDNYTAGQKPKLGTDADGNCYFRALVSSNGGKTTYEELRKELVAKISEEPEKTQFNLMCQINKEMIAELKKLKDELYNDENLKNELDKALELFMQKLGSLSEKELLLKLQEKTLLSGVSENILNNQQFEQLVKQLIDAKEVFKSINITSDKLWETVDEMMKQKDPSVYYGNLWKNNMLKDKTWGGEPCLTKAYAMIYGPVGLVNEKNPVGSKPMIIGEAPGLEKILTIMKQKDEAKAVKKQNAVEQESKPEQQPQAVVQKSPVVQNKLLTADEYAQVTKDLATTLQQLMNSGADKKWPADLALKHRENFLKWRKIEEWNETKTFGKDQAESFKKYTKVDLSNEIIQEFLVLQEKWYQAAKKLDILHWMPAKKGEGKTELLTNEEIIAEIKNLTKIKSKDFWEKDLTKEKFKLGELGTHKVELNTGKACVVGEDKKPVMSAHMTSDDKPFFTMKVNTSFAELEKHKDEIKAVLGEGTLAISAELKTVNNIKGPAICYFLVAQGNQVKVRPNGGGTEREMLISRIINPKDDWMHAVKAVMAGQIDKPERKELSSKEFIGFDGKIIKPEDGGEILKFDQKIAVESLVFGVLGLPKKPNEEISSEAQKFLSELKVKLASITEENKDKSDNKEIMNFMQQIKSNPYLKTALESACGENKDYAIISDELNKKVPEPVLLVPSGPKQQ